MRRLLAWIYRNANLRNLVIAIMVIIPINFLAFPRMAWHFRNLSGGVSTLDVQFAYTPAEALRIVGNYSSPARNFYLLIEWTADLLYPATYATLFALLLALILKTAVAEDHPFRSFALLPYLMMVADYTENISISLLLLLYPPGILAAIAATASFLKWLFGGLIILALILSIIQMVRALLHREPARKDL